MLAIAQPAIQNYQCLCIDSAQAFLPSGDCEPRAAAKPPSIRALCGTSCVSEEASTRQHSAGSVLRPRRSPGSNASSAQGERTDLSVNHEQGSDLGGNYGRTFGGGNGGGGGGHQEPDSRLEGHVVLVTGRFGDTFRAHIEEKVLRMGGKVQSGGPNGINCRVLDSCCKQSSLF
jgi:hypothetical protein